MASRTRILRYLPSSAVPWPSSSRVGFHEYTETEKQHREIDYLLMLCIYVFMCLVSMYLCICVFVYLCICVFVYCVLCIVYCVFVYIMYFCISVFLYFCIFVFVYIFVYLCICVFM